MKLIAIVYSGPLQYLSSALLHAQCMQHAAAAASGTHGERRSWMIPYKDTVTASAQQSST